MTWNQYSGLLVRRYSASGLHAEFGSPFKMLGRDMKRSAPNAIQHITKLCVLLLPRSIRVIRLSKTDI